MNSSKNDTALFEALERARFAQSRSEWSDLKTYAVRALELARQAGDHSAEGQALRLRAIADRETGGDPASIALDLRRAVALLRAAGDVRMRAYAEGSLAGFLVAQGEGIEALAMIDAAERSLLAAGLHEDAQRCQHQRAWADLVSGCYRSALARSRDAVPVDRAMMSADGEGWALECGALAATYLGDLDTALDFSEALLSLRRLAGNAGELVESHLIRYRILAKLGREGALDALSSMVAAVEGAGAIRATALAILADATLGARPTLRAFLARDAAQASRAPRGPWAVAEFRHLDERWGAMPIRREGRTLVVDLDRAGCLPEEHLILDRARVDAAAERADTKTRQAEDLCVSRRNYYKILAGLESHLSDGTPKRRRRLER